MFSKIVARKVEITPLKSIDNDYQLSKFYDEFKITVNEEFSHVFKKNTKEASMLATTDHDSIVSYFIGGTFVLYDGSMVDYRPSTYKGYIQDVATMESMAELIGFEVVEKRAYSTPVHGLLSDVKKKGDVIWSGKGGTFDVVVPSLGDGGLFEAGLVYGWSPFSPNVKTTLETTRLVCNNGMYSTAAFASYETPMINDIEENLRIVSKALTPRVQSDLTVRLEQMAKQRASVQVVRKANSIFGGHLKDLNKEDNLTSWANLRNMDALTSDEILSKYYHSDALENKALTSVLPSHLSSLDVLNILTEASTHYITDVDGRLSVNKLASSIMFDDVRSQTSIGSITKVPESPYSDHNKAFFGKDSI